MNAKQEEVFAWTDEREVRSTIIHGFHKVELDGALQNAGASALDSLVFVPQRMIQ